MTQDIQVRCMIDRFWGPEIRQYDGMWVEGTLIDITTQSTDDNSGKLIPVGIVLLDDNTFQSVPMEFVTRI